MRLGLCLAGGGAKGAYQAGVLKGLKDRGIDKFDLISGTSIGSINGYYLFTGNEEKMCEMWTNIQNNSQTQIKIIDNTVDNSYAIDPLYDLEYKNIHNIGFYVNYIYIDNCNIKEKIVNISKLEKMKAIESIKYSSLLPFNPNKTLRFDEQFKKDMSEGMYDGYNLDGGLVNNTLLIPLIEEKMDKIILISTNKDYTLPDYINGIYSHDNIIIIRPEREFATKDTLNFESEFCKQIFREGYNIAKNINLNI